MNPYYHNPQHSNPYSQFPRPAFVDPNSKIVYDVNHADLEGWLTKQSMWMKEWRRRYFILKGSRIFYAKNQYTAPHGMIDLSTCTTVKSADLKTRKKNSFEISTHDTTYLLYADSDKDKDDWIGGIGRAIVRCSTTFQSKEYTVNRKGYSYPDETDPLHGHLDAASHRRNANNDDGDYDDDDYSNSSNNPYFND